MKSNRSANEALQDFMRDFVSQSRDHDYGHEKLTSSEKRNRQRAVNAARATVRLEGFTPSVEREDAACRYVAGEIDLDGFLYGF